MAEPQLSVRSARARALAHHLAQREQRSIAQVVERALELYAQRRSHQEPAAAFYGRLQHMAAEGEDLDRLFARESSPHIGVSL
jgi:hypothetical protein